MEHSDHDSSEKITGDPTPVLGEDETDEWCGLPEDDWECLKAETTYCQEQCPFRGIGWGD